MKLYRIGDKLLDRDKIIKVIDEIIDLRLKGLSQQEVAKKLGIDRTFISRMEGIGEVHRGKKIGVIGFPIGNKQDLLKMLREEGIDFNLIMNDEERIKFTKEKSGLEFLNIVMELVEEARSCDTVIVMGSNYRIKVCEALLAQEVVGVEIGVTPIQEDIIVDVERIRKLIRLLRQNT
ncbi:MAG: helix-turn-helix domain-containing protein [Zhaonellaceae bacterium]|nr:helix-turn-helix domain-containing protein [Clostridia bacterium]